MKLIHSADWHLGHTFYGYDRRYEYTLFLEWLLDVIVKESADLLLLAGDVFDTSNPSADAQEMYYSFLARLSKESPKTQIIIVAGNHDSANRLEAPNSILKHFNVYVRGILPRNHDGTINYEHLIVPIEGGGCCLAIPFIRSSDAIGTDYINSVKTVYQNCFQIASEKGYSPIIAMGHLQASGAILSQGDRSERMIIGGLETVDYETFDKSIAYTALGHLHREQRVFGRENIRYSGTPIPISFAEKNSKHGVTVVEIENGTMEYRNVLFDSPVKLLSIPETPQSTSEVIMLLSSLPVGEITNESPFLEIKIEISQPEPTLKSKIADILADKSVRLAKIETTYSKGEVDVKRYTIDEFQTKVTPLDIAESVYNTKYGEMNSELKEMMQEIIAICNE